MAQHPDSSLGCLIVEVSRAHKIRHTVKARHRGRNLQNEKEIQDKNIHHLSGIRTRNPYNRVSVNLHVRPHDCWDRLVLLRTVGNYEVDSLGGFLRHNQHSYCEIWPAESNLK